MLRRYAAQDTNPEMPMPRHSRSFNRFFAGWLAAVAASAVLLVWACDAFDTRQSVSVGASMNPVLEKKTPPPSPKTPVPPFDEDTAQYLVTAFPMRGVCQTDDAAPSLSLFSPESSLTAQVIERASQPEVLTDGVSVRYRLEDAYADGRNKDAASGELAADTEGLAFTAGSIAVAPYGAGTFQPYPVAVVEALDEGGVILASTGVTLAVSSETGCRNCHRGPWKDGTNGGISEITAADILALHDKRKGTDFADLVKEGGTVQCASCHSGKGDEPNLSTAVHGFHATMQLKGSAACGLCHASSEDGATRFYRGYHNLLGLDCTRCHGALSDHAISLLRHEADRGSPAAAKRLAQIRPDSVARTSDIHPREPGVNLPQCAGCHDFIKKPDASTSTAFNKWTKDESERFTRAFEDTGELRCPSCHGAPHALYPSTNPTGDERDNIQPLQYQGIAAPLGKGGNCAVCHTHDMDVFPHHGRVEQEAL